jgi:hypothetical protein
LIPSNLFFDLVDAQISFKIVQRNFNGPTTIFCVARASEGTLRLTVIGGQPLIGPADTVLARLNTLIGQHPTRQPQHSFRQSTVKGKVVNYTLIPEAEKGRHGLPEELSVECRFIPFEHPCPERETIIVNVIVAGRQSLHLMEQVGKENLQEISRLSPHALPRDIHEKLAANGYYERSFVTLYGYEALEEVKAKLTEDTLNCPSTTDLSEQQAHH